MSTPWTVVSFGRHYKKPAKRVGLVKGGHHIIIITSNAIWSCYIAGKLLILAKQ